MEIMTQERYKEYRKSLKDQGYPTFETIANFPTKETYRLLEQRHELIRSEKYKNASTMEKAIMMLNFYRSQS